MINNIKYNKTKHDIILCNYPKSGSNWFSYCLYIIFDINISESTHDISSPVDKIKLFDKSKPSDGIKTHVHRKDLYEMVKYNKDCILLNITRDYKEVIPRFGSKTMTVRIMSGKLDDLRKDRKFDYVLPLKLYEEHRNDRKYLVYYEDFITDIKKSLYNLSDFLKQFNYKQQLSIDDFVKNFEYHKNKSLESYVKTVGESITKGNFIKYYHKTINESYLKMATEHLKYNFPILFNKYLKRYE